MEIRMIRTLVIAIAALVFATSAQAKYKVITVSDGGAVKGKVSLGSAKVNTAEFTISKDPQICGTGIRKVPMVRANGDALLDAVVYLVKVKKGKAMPKSLSTLKLNQKGCSFAPYLSVMSNKGTLEALNSDPTLHNIHVYEEIGRARRTVFNVSQPDQGSVVKKKISLRRGDGLKIECDAHDFMHAFAFVAKNPYFAVVNDKGEYQIKDIPPGDYVIQVWHGVLGIKKGKVTVAAGGAASVDFSY